jgi:hypothetical protein
VLGYVVAPTTGHALPLDYGTPKRHSNMSALIEVLMLTTMAVAEPNIALYELKENCEKPAAETFHRETPDDEDRVDYRAHYNARRSKCFYMETYISPTPVGTNRWGCLSDLQRNRIYGGFHRSSNIGLFYCNLEDKECHSEAEWNELVTLYMQD